MVLDAVLALRESGATAVSIKAWGLSIEAAFPDPEEEEEVAHVGMGFCLDPEADEDEDDVV